MALTNKLEAIGNAIREKTGTADKMTLDQMVTAIAGITTGGGSGGDLYDYIPEEALNITGNCNCKFTGDSWKWFVDMYGDKIMTSDLTNVEEMFLSYSGLTIPFDINIKNDGSVELDSIFLYAKIEKPPYINGKIKGGSSVFKNCYYMKSIPNDWADRIDWSLMNSSTTSYAKEWFSSNYSLREIPSNILSKKYNAASTTTYGMYSNEFSYCYALDCINGLAVSPATLTTNHFINAFQRNGRVKNITFSMKSDGTPYDANWKSQTIALNVYVGYAYNATTIMQYSLYHGIKSEKQVNDDSTYQLLKNDPDWWTIDLAYSRYNHDSAVETINSLPDTSAYLATAGGTNTIKFNGASGALTDGGAINTLTEEEIAVAAAKGWTVTFA